MSSTGTMDDQTENTDSRLGKDLIALVLLLVGNIVTCWGFYGVWGWNAVLIYVGVLCTGGGVVLGLARTR